MSVKLLTEDELRIVCGAVNEVLEMYEGDELHARLGVTEAELEALFDKLSSMLERGRSCQGGKR